MKNFLRLSAITLVLPGLVTLAIPQQAKAINQFDVCMEQILKSGVTPEQASTACSSALNPRDLSYCIQKITNRTEIKAEDALKNCYRVRRPVDLAQCVTNINNTILQPPANKEKPKNTRTENTGTSTENTENTDSDSETMDDTDNMLSDTETMDNQDSTMSDTENMNNEDSMMSETEPTESPLMVALNSCRTSLLPARHSECVIGLSRSSDSISPVKAMETCLSAEDFPRDLFSAE
jgi:hypothetical protein